MSATMNRRLARLFGSLLCLALLLAACDFAAPNATPTPGAELSPTAPNAAGRPSGPPPGTTPDNQPVGGQPAGDQPAGTTQGNQPAVEQPAPPAAQPPNITSSTPAAPQGAADAGRTTVAQPGTLKGWIAYVGIDQDIWLMQSNGQGATRVVDNPTTGAGAEAFVERLAWSPGGRKLLYTVTDANAHTLYAWDADRGTVTDLGAVAGDAPTGAWLPDGVSIAIPRPDGSIVVHQLPAWDQNGQIIPGSEQEVALGKGSAPVWIPEPGQCGRGGSLDPIAFVRDGNLWLTAYPPQAGSERQLTRYAAGGSISGTLYVWNCQLLFYGTPAGAGTQALYALPLRAGQARPFLAANPAGPTTIRSLSISPDGQYLGLTESSNINACVQAGAARTLSYTGQRVAPVAMPVDQAGYHVRTYGLTWGPRGLPSQYVISYSQQTCSSPDPKTLKAITQPRMYLYRTNGQLPRLYLGEGTWPAWNGGMMGLGSGPANGH